jgi:hypothetical protein
MKGTMNWMDHRGHTTLEWDTAVDDHHLHEVEFAFERLTQNGYMAANTTALGTREQVKAFDSRVHTRVTMYPPMAGGS